MAYLLIVINVFAGLAEGIFIKQYNTRHVHGGFVFTGIISLFAMLYFVLTDAGAFVVTPVLVPYAAISGILYCVASVLTYFALACGSFAMSMLVLSYSILFSIGYGTIFLGEPVTTFSVIGFALLLVSLYLTRGNSMGGKVSVKWLVLIILSAVANGMYGIVIRIQQIRFEGAYDNECMALCLGLSTAFLFAVGVFTEGKHIKEIVRYGVPYAMGAGLINGFRNMLSILVYTMMPISLSSALTSGIKIVVSFAVSALLFQERFLKRQIVGVIVGAFALVFLNI